MPKQFNKTAVFVQIYIGVKLCKQGQSSVNKDKNKTQSDLKLHDSNAEGMRIKTHTHKSGIITRTNQNSLNKNP